MKKFLAILMVLVMVATMAACGAAEEVDSSVAEEVESVTEEVESAEAEEEVDPAAKSEGVMTYAEYEAAELDSEVVVEVYVQATQGWWFDSDAGHGKITVYAQDPDGGYFIYEMKCDEADADKVLPGSKIKVTGYKAEWAGEVEIMDATFEAVEGNWVAEEMDATDLLGTDELIKHQNKLVTFTGLTLEAIEYKNGEPGDDIYVTFSKDGESYNFCVESYLTPSDSLVYEAVGELEVGAVVDVTGFLYWYEGVNTHITGIATVE